MFVHPTNKNFFLSCVQLSVILLTLFQFTTETYVSGYASSARLNRLQRQRTLRSPTSPPLQRTVPPPSSFNVPTYIKYRGKNQKKNHAVNAVVSLVKVNQFVQNIRSTYTASRSLEACTAFCPETKRRGHHQILLSIDGKMSSSVYIACVVLKLSATMGRFSGYTFADSSPANWVD